MSCLVCMPSAELTRMVPFLSLQSKDAEITQSEKKELLQMCASSPITPSEHLVHRDVIQESWF